MSIAMTEQTYTELCNESGGVCLACSALVYGGTEPDAEDYECEECGAHKVQGIENALICGNIHFVSAKETGEEESEE